MDIQVPRACIKLSPTPPCWHTKSFTSVASCSFKASELVSELSRNSSKNAPAPSKKRGQNIRHLWHIPQTMGCLDHMFSPCLFLALSGSPSNNSGNHCNCLATEEARFQALNPPNCSKASGKASSPINRSQANSPTSPLASPMRRMGVQQNASRPLSAKSSKPVRAVAEECSLLDEDDEMDRYGSVLGRV